MPNELSYTNNPKLRRSIFNEMVAESDKHPDTSMKFKELCLELGVNNGTMTGSEVMGILAVMQALQTEMLEQMYGPGAFDGMPGYVPGEPNGASK
jgi:hypothetical protein